MSTPFADTKTIRAAIFDVIDQGHQCDKGPAECGLFHAWEFEFRFPETDEENQNRANFVAAVIDRIADLHSIPGETIKLQDLCGECVKRALTLPESRALFCIQCSAEQKAKGQGA
jgi:hypothetical protein